MYIGQLPPAGLSLVVILKPSPWTPFMSSSSIFFPIFLVLAVRRLLSFVEPPGTFFVGDTVATFVFELTRN